MNKYRNIIKSAVFALLIVLVLSIFWLIFGRDKYKSSNYEYKIDLSTMSMVDTESNEVDKFLDALSNYDKISCKIDLKAYVNNRNGWKKESITFNQYDKSKCFADIETKTGIIKTVKTGVAQEYKDEFTPNKNNLNRLYTSGTGAIGVFQFEKEVNGLGKLNMTGYILTDNTYHKLAEVYVGKNTSGKLVYKKEIVWGE